jgi:hypothetical protein
MYRDDYILRMIRRFGQVIAYIAGLRRQGQYPMALLACDDAMRNALGIGSEEAAGRSEREILALIRFADRDGSWRELAAYVAAVFHAEACIYEAQSDQELVPPRALLALQLLVEADLAEGAAAPDVSGTFSPLLAEASSGPLPDYAPPREHLLELLHGYSLPARTRGALFALYEREGTFAKAEDTLFELLADAPDDAELRRAGIAFYGRLLAQSDDALVAGGLSRTEAEASLAELQRP